MGSDSNHCRGDVIDVNVVCITDGSVDVLPLPLLLLPQLLLLLVQLPLLLPQLPLLVRCAAVSGSACGR
jgi:hypothetical protein